MIVDRRTWDIAFGQADKAIELLKAEIEAAQKAGQIGSYRMYVSRIGQWGQVAVEYEFETLAEQEAFWAAWRPKHPSFIKEWFALNRGNIQIEIWDMV